MNYFSLGSSCLCIQIESSATDTIALEFIGSRVQSSDAFEVMDHFVVFRQVFASQKESCTNAPRDGIPVNTMLEQHLEGIKLP